MAQEKLFTASITLPGGKRKYFRAKTKAELSAKLDAARFAIGQGINIDDSTTLTELAQTWFDTVKKPVIRATTANALKSNLNLCVLQPFIAGMKVQDIKEIQYLAGHPTLDFPAQVGNTYFILLPQKHPGKAVALPGSAIILRPSALLWFRPEF